MNTQILAAVLIACAPSNANGAVASTTRMPARITDSTRLRGGSPDRIAPIMAALSPRAAEHSPLRGEDVRP